MLKRNSKPHGPKTSIKHLHDNMPKALEMIASGYSLHYSMKVVFGPRYISYIRAMSRMDEYRSFYTEYVNNAMTKRRNFLYSRDIAADREIRRIEKIKAKMKREENVQDIISDNLYS